ncbi:MAG TPA: alpha/beta fold hydrolase [Thermoanaerobaculia bacterium]|nr:alpha/beta fold hydrolase [Thermoanaerobaculia bacterium]
MHGLGGSADWWRRNIDALAAEHLVVAVDLVGFGRNRFFIQRSSLPLGFRDVAALLGRWIESAFQEPVHVVGVSMGGHTAIHLAAARPDLVRSLTLVNTTGIPFELAPGRHLANIIIPRGALSFSTILARDALRSGPMSIAVAFARLLRDDARPLIKSIRVPTLLLWGDRDPLVPLSYARQLKEMIPASRLVTIPNAGHIPMWENPAAFNAALLEFLREVDRGQAILPVRTGEIARPPFAWPITGVASHIAYRQAGTRRDAVLIHGLGMSSAYLGHLASALFDSGLHAIAPDLVEPLSPVEHARKLIDWADALSMRNAIWVGHSLGCNIVGHVARLRPDLVRELVCVGPLWTRARHPMGRLLRRLLLDAFREPLALYAYVIPAYWNTGLARWWTTFYRSLGDIRNEPPSGLMIAGERDPLPDMPDIVRVPGAHACLFSNPAEVTRLLVAHSPGSA